MVVVPALASTVEALTGAVDDRRARAPSRRARRSAAQLVARRARTVRGEVGADDPVQAVEDALRDFGADEIVIADDPEGRSHWLEQGRRHGGPRRFACPVTHVIVDLDAEVWRGPFLESDAVPHLRDRSAEVLVRLARAVGRPALALVEAPRAGVVVEHPEDAVAAARSRASRRRLRASAPAPAPVPHASGST